MAKNSNACTALPEQADRYVHGLRGALAAFIGSRFTVGAVEEKVLRVLLTGGAGCDAQITEATFQVQHGPRHWPTDYYPEPLPGVIQRLLEWSGKSLPTREVRALLRVGDPLRPLPGWFKEPRLLWLRAEPDQIYLSIRPDGGAGEAALATWPEPLPPLVQGQRIYREFEASHSCPHCGALSRRFRELVDTRLVCGACARSFTPVEVTHA